MAKNKSKERSEILHGPNIVPMRVKAIGVWSFISSGREDHFWVLFSGEVISFQTGSLNEILNGAK